jgi:FkbH-like protein
MGDLQNFSTKKEQTTMTILNEKNNFTFISDVVSQILFSDIEKSIIFQHAKFDHYTINDFIGGLVNIPQEHQIVLHFSPFFISDRKALSELKKITSDICLALKSRLMKAKSKIYINTLHAKINFISLADYLQYTNLILGFNTEICNLADEFDNLTIIGLDRVRDELNYTTGCQLKNYDVIGMPYSREIAASISKSYRFVIESTFSIKKKVLILDADNTLWKGIVGEDGIDGIKIDGCYPGSVFRDFQILLKKYQQSGILLCLCTKNNLTDIIEVFENVSMPLVLSDFIIIKANWSRKSENIKEILDQLNLGRESVLFIDDNPFEVEEVKSNLPGVEALRFDYKAADKVYNLITGRADLYLHSLTSEDLQKTQMYRSEIERKDERATYASEDEYIDSLNLKITTHVNNRKHISRASQMTMKTNQFNLTSRRYSGEHIEHFMDEHTVFTFNAEDKYGDLGVVGLIIVANEKIDTFLLSCRAFGRKMEFKMFEECIRHFEQTNLSAKYHRTKKNPMVADFYDRCGMIRTYVEDNQISYKL